MSAMSDNLAIELNKLEFRIKEDPTVAQVTPRAGSGGGGVFSLYLILLLAAAGIRAQAVMNDSTLVHDFLFAEGPRSMQVCNAPSPVATFAIPTGRYICDKAEAAGNS